MLVWTRGNDLQLTSAVETGITPANLMHSDTTTQVIPSEPLLPSLAPGESVYGSIAVTDESRHLASAILNDAYQWNRLRPIYRDWLLSFCRSAEKRNARDHNLTGVLLRISTFYPDDPDVLLLLSMVYYTRKEYIVTLYLAKTLLDCQLKNNGRTAEALTNMAAAYAALVSHNVVSGLAESC